MGVFVNRNSIKLLSSTVAFLIAILNLWFLIQTFRHHT